MAEMDKFTDLDDQRYQMARDLDKLLNRIHLLRPDDKSLIEAYLRYSIPFARIARISGVSERTTSRRIKRLMNRLSRDDYLIILRYRNFFTKIELNIAYDHYLLGLGSRLLARKHNLTPYKSLKMIRKLDNFIQSYRDSKITYPRKCYTND